MEKHHLKIFSLILAVAVVLGAAASAKAQSGGGVTVGRSRGPHPAWEGKVAGDVQPYERNNDDLKISLLSQPIPNVWLEFAESKREGQPPRKPSDDKEPVIQVVLPPEAKEILKSYCEEALRFDYNEAFVKPRSAQEQYDRDIAWINKCRVGTQKLEQVEIDAPDGKRKISDLEAHDLVYFVRRASANLVDEAKGKRKNGKIARLNRAAEQFVGRERRERVSHHN